MSTNRSITVQGWCAEPEAEAWVRPIEADAVVVKLKTLAAEALAEYEAAQYI